MFRTLTICLLLILSGFNPALSQNSLYSYYGDSASWDVGSKAIETLDENILVAGYSWSNGGYNGVLLKLNPAGDTLWTRTFSDTTGNSQITGGQITQLADSGFMLVYSLTDQSCNDHILFFRLNNVGDTLWTKRFGFAHDKTDYICSVIETSDNGFIAVGESDHGNTSTTDMRGLIMKLDENGDTLWTKTYKNFREAYFQDIKETPESDFIICGTSLDADSTNGFYINLLKIDESGNLLWIKYIGVPGFSAARNIIVADDGYIFTGETVVNNEFKNYILKTDTSGNTIWCKKYELGPYIGVNSKMSKCLSGGYFFSENITDSTLISKSLLVKMDDNGIPIWTGLYDGKPAAAVVGICGTSDGGCILTGTYADTLNDFPMVFLIDEDFLVIKVDSTGFVNCHYSQINVSYSSVATSEVFLPLEISSGINQYDHLIIVSSGYPGGNTCSVTGLFNNFTDVNTLNVYPNPSDGMFNITGFNESENLILRLYDMRGSLVLQEKVNSKPDNTIAISLVIPDGLYQLQLIDNDKNYFQKIIVTNK